VKNRHTRRAEKARHGWLPLERATLIRKTPEQLEALFRHTKEAFGDQFTDDEIWRNLHAANGELGNIWKNDTYQVHVIRHDGAGPNGCDIVQLSIKRLDQRPARDWRDFQRIKDQLVGPECEGVELYPAQSRLVDTANQFHVWCVENPAYRWPIGYATRHVSGKSGAGTMQRPFETSNQE
jgi:hypothetical protein